MILEALFRVFVLLQPAGCGVEGFCHINPPLHGSTATDSSYARTTFISLTNENSALLCFPFSRLSKNCLSRTDSVKLLLISVWTPCHFVFAALV